MDLSVWLHGHRYRSLLQLIDQLPEASRTRAAVLNDPEEAERIARMLEESDEEPEPWSPDIRYWDQNSILLREIREAIIAVFGTTHLAATNKKAPSVPPLPTPRTEVERARERYATAQVQSLISRLLPHQ